MTAQSEHTGDQVGDVCTEEGDGVYIGQRMLTVELQAGEKPQRRTSKLTM